ncbi:MAG: esterase-like activity of phytase family protein [Gammaproteobacteria bacterium]|nr:esterase-like activity of phytase family protein [Gammaproteobacteria bacterium]
MRTFILVCLLVTLTACTDLMVRKVRLSSQHRPGETYMGIRLHGTLRLSSDEIGGLKTGGLSDLAWDEDERLLYAVSDIGNIFHLRPVIADNTLVDVQMIKALPLRDERGRPLGNRRKMRDAEGLSAVNTRNGTTGDTELLISFERVPRIARYTPGGKFISLYVLPKPLQDVKNYRGGNHALEAVAIHPRFGILTASEYPLRGEDTYSIYSLNGKRWDVSAYPAPNSALTALETLEDGSLLMLERAFVSVAKPFIVSLRRIWLPRQNTPPLFRQAALFDDTKGWQLDNFEGLARHRKTFFFMISDDNINPLQQTLLSYFELLPQT